MQLIDLMPEEERQEFKKDLIVSLTSMMPLSEDSIRKNMIEYVDSLPKATVYIVSDSDIKPSKYSQGSIIYSTKTNRTYTILTEGLVEIGALR